MDSWHEDATACYLMPEICRTQPLTAFLMGLTIYKQGVISFMTTRITLYLWGWYPDYIYGTIAPLELNCLTIGCYMYIVGALIPRSLVSYMCM